MKFSRNPHQSGNTISMHGCQQNIWPVSVLTAVSMQVCFDLAYNLSHQVILIRALLHLFKSPFITARVEDQNNIKLPDLIQRFMLRSQWNLNHINVKNIGIMLICAYNPHERRGFDIWIINLKGWLFPVPLTFLWYLVEQTDTNSYIWYDYKRSINLLNRD